MAQEHPIGAASDASVEPRIVGKVMLRLIPLLVGLYILNYIDRVNVAFAKLQMSKELGFSDAVYGFGAGIFFVGYFLFEVPSNLIMQRVGARLWMARIMISWGIISSAFIFVRGPVSFYTLRFLLGVAEAGFAPGVLLYLTYWIPLKQQARAVAWFLTSTALAGVIGSPLAGLILKLDGVHLLAHRLAGWQWLFLLEGIPSVIGGIVILLVLTDRPEEARWLTAEQRKWLSDYLEIERQDRQTHGHLSLREGLLDPKVLLLSLAYCTIMFGFQGINFWMPTIIKEVTRFEDNLRVGLISAVPYAVAVIAMVIIGRHSDHSGERRRHVAVCAAVGAIGLGACAFTSSPLLAVILLSLAAAGIWGTLGPFWALPPAFLGGTAAAAGIAFINSLGNLGGGFFAQQAMGQLKDHYHSYKPGLIVYSAVLLGGGCLILALRKCGMMNDE